MYKPSDSKAPGATSPSAEVDGAEPAAPSTNPADAALTQPRLISKVEPSYTDEAVKARLEGTVNLKITVDELGVPQDITVIKSLGLGLDEKAREAVSKWRFSPGTKDGKPVKTPAIVEVNFHFAEHPK